MGRKIAPRNEPHAQLKRIMDLHEAAGPREGANMRDIDELLILSLDNVGTYGQRDIARIVRCSDKTVAAVLASYGDTRVYARKHLDARALEMAKRFVTEAEPPELLKALGKLDVVRDDKSAGDVGGVQIIIGVPGQANALLAPPVIDIS